MLLFFYQKPQTEYYYYLARDAKPFHGGNMGFLRSREVPIVVSIKRQRSGENNIALRKSGYIWYPSVKINKLTSLRYIKSLQGFTAYISGGKRAKLEHNMISLLFILINLIMLLSYTKYPKRLHPIRAATCYMVSFIYIHNYLVIPSINLGDWEITKRIDYGLIITLNNVIAVPVAALLFIEIYTVARDFQEKLMTICTWVLFMLLFEYLHDWFGLIHHKSWKISWSILVWFFLGIFLIVITKIMKRMMMKLGDVK